MIKARHALLSLFLLGGLMTLLTTPAMAFRGHEFSFSFGALGSGNGQFKEPSGVAVNNATGQVYVLDQGNGRVERFSSMGAYEVQFNGSESPAKAFQFGTEALPGGIAVDNSCYFKKLSGSACSTADPSNGDVYVTDPEHCVVDKFGPTGIYICQLQEGLGGAPFPFEFKELKTSKGKCESRVGIYGVGVDTSGTVWVYYEGGHSSGDVANFTNTELNGKGEANTFISTRPLENTGHDFSRPGFAVDSEDNFYARRISGFFFVSQYSSSGMNPTTWPILSAPFVAEETSAVGADLASGEVFLDNVGSVGGFSASGVLQERFGLGHLTGGSGLAVNHENSTSSTVYVADSVANVVDVNPPEPPKFPTVEGESVSKVTGDSATFEAEVNPRGASTEYHFEYGRCVTPGACASSGYEKNVPVPDGFVGSDFEVHGVSAHLQGLLAGAVYHFRVVAHNEIKGKNEVVAGEELSFTMQVTGAFALPDARAWELVSPPDKLGARIGPIGSASAIQASVAGDAITYHASGPTESEPQGNSSGVQVLSTRGRGGWSSRDLSVPHSTATGASQNGEEYRFFSEDLSFGVAQPFGAFTPCVLLEGAKQPCLSEEASEQTAFLHTDYLHGNVSEPCASSCYRPLVAGCPPPGEECRRVVEEHANVSPGTKFGEEGQCPQKKVVCGPEFVGGTQNLSHVMLRSSVALTVRSGKGGLYEWSGGQLALVSMLPKNGGSASGELAGGRHAISDDGSRVVWESSHHLYMSKPATEEAVQLDAVQGGEGINEPKPEFQVASGDGSKVFFIDDQRLTEGSGGENESNHGDLYECEIVEGADGLKCVLSDLTPLNTKGESVHVHAVLGASEDGSWVYFAADSVLAPGAVPGNCGGPGGAPSAAATCNLYVRHGGVTSLMAVVSSEDFGDWARSNTTNLDRLTARVSPNGGWLAFMSQRSLTGYDNRDAVSGKPDEQVFLYHAPADLATEHGGLVCASCNPTGARPIGVEFGRTGLPLVSHTEDWNPTTWLAGNVPGWTAYATGQALYQSRYLSDSGRLFFNSNDALVPQDVNGTWDVYEYEPPGVGNCTMVSVTFSGRSGGCVGLISSGASPEESAFLDASESGGDVFFLTLSRLSPRDFDTSLDVYDAHECTAVSPCVSEEGSGFSLCDTEASCKPAPALQPSIFGAPSSATFSGAGNVPPVSRPVVKPKPKTVRCRKPRRLRRGKCVKSVKHAGRAKRAGRAK